MMLAAVASILIGQGSMFRQMDLGPNITLQIRESRLEPAKLSPKEFDGTKWEFDWLSAGFGKMDEQGVKAIKVRVYSQQKDNRGELVARMMMRMWDRLYHQYRIDHPMQYMGGIVDTFLCFGGEPGGYQEIGSEAIAANPGLTKVNTIYIFQLSSFKDPVEMAREVAHEYGHAVLPAVGGFKAPEDWGNGYLGEKLFLRWIRDDMAAGRLTPDDAMGASADQLDKWVKKNLDPLVKKAATEYPDPSKMMEGATGMDNWIGLASYIDQLCPPQVLATSLRLTTMRPPKDYPDQVVEAASSLPQLTLSVPKSLESAKTLWIPLGKGNLSGGNVLKRKGGWAQVAPLRSIMVITNRHDG